MIGDIYIKNIDHKQQSCEIGIHIVNDSYKSKGYGTIAVKQMIQRIIKETEIEAVYAETKRSNDRCKRMLKKAGFFKIGVKEQYDVYIYRMVQETTKEA